VWSKCLEHNLILQSLCILFLLNFTPITNDYKLDTGGFPALLFFNLWRPLRDVAFSHYSSRCNTKFNDTWLGLIWTELWRNHWIVSMASQTLFLCHLKIAKKKARTESKILFLQQKIPRSALFIIFEISARLLTMILCFDASHLTGCDGLGIW